jgi:polyisoprenoid-binding protein YceI
MKMFDKFIFAVLLSVGTVGSAQQQTMTVDPASSNVKFALTGTGHEVHGTFHVSQGTIKFDRTAPAMSGSIVVSAASGDSGEKSRDKKMHSDVLDVAHYADVTFEPKSYQGTIASTGDSSIQVSGVFTLHGTPHDITVPMQVHIDGVNVTAKGSFIVPYVQWGLKDPSIMFLKVAKEVHVNLDLHGSLSSSN